MTQLWYTLVLILDDKKALRSLPFNTFEVKLTIKYLGWGVNILQKNNSIILIFTCNTHKNLTGWGDVVDA